jgi:hypothetical protein
MSIYELYIIVDHIYQEFHDYGINFACINFASFFYSRDFNFTNWTYRIGHLLTQKTMQWCSI